MPTAVSHLFDINSVENESTQTTSPECDQLHIDLPDGPFDTAMKINTIAQDSSNKASICIPDNISAAQLEATLLQWLAVQVKGVDVNALHVAIKQGETMTDITKGVNEYFQSQYSQSPMDNSSHPDTGTKFTWNTDIL